MELIEVYVYEVTRRLPEKNRQDIAMELQSTIEDMLPESYSEEELMEVLKKLGDPAKLAAKYRDTPSYLIGPRVYDAYVEVMKLAVPWAILIAILVQIVDSVLSFSVDEPLIPAITGTMGMLIGSVVEVLIQVFFWITLTFFLIDRYAGSSDNLSEMMGGQKWNPLSLKNVQIIPKKKIIKRSEVVFGIFWSVIGLLFYFNADRFIGVYRQMDGEGLRMVMPVFDNPVLLSYWPIVVVISALQIGVLLYKFKEKLWTRKLAVTNAVMHVLSILVLVYIASNPALINEAVGPYMVDLLEIDYTSFDNFINWAKWTVIISIVVAVAIEVFDSFRKANMRI